MWGDAPTEYAHNCQHVTGLIRQYAKLPATSLLDIGCGGGKTKEQNNPPGPLVLKRRLGWIIINSGLDFHPEDKEFYLPGSAFQCLPAAGTPGNAKGRAGRGDERTIRI
jgi:hypothetical protein